MNKKYIILASLIGSVSLGGIGYGSYFAYQNYVEKNLELNAAPEQQKEEAYKNTYSTGEINDYVFALQKKVIEKAIEQQQKIKETQSPLSQSGSFKIDFSATNPMFGEGKISFSNNEYRSQYSLSGSSLSFEDLQGSAIIKSPMKNISFSGGLDKIDIREKNGTGYILVSGLKLPQGDRTLEQIFPSYLVETLNQLSNSGTYIEFPFVANSLASNSSFTQIPFSGKKIENLDFNTEILTTYPWFEVSKQEDTKYFLQPSHDLCKITKYIMEQKNPKRFPSNGNTQTGLENNDALFPSVETISQQEACDEKTYASFVKDFEEKLSVYVEKSSTSSHVSLGFQKKGKNIANFDSYFGFQSLKKATFSSQIEELSSTGNTFSGSGIYLELEKSSLKGYVDIAKKENNSYTKIQFYPNEQGQNIFIGESYGEKEKRVSNFILPRSSTGANNSSQIPKEKEYTKMSFSGSFESQKQFFSGILEAWETKQEASGEKSLYHIEGKNQKIAEKWNGNISLSGKIPAKSKYQKEMNFLVESNWGLQTTPTLQDYNFSASFTGVMESYGNISIQGKNQKTPFDESKIQVPKDIIRFEDFENTIKKEKRKYDIQQRKILLEKQKMLQTKTSPFQVK